MGNAIKSTLHGAALKSNNKEGARSIQVEITPTSSRISRNAVTSLSIRGHRWKRHGKTGEQHCLDLVQFKEHYQIQRLKGGKAGGKKAVLLLSPLYYPVLSSSFSHMGRNCHLASQNPQSQNRNFLFDVLLSHTDGCTKGSREF